MKKLFFLVVTIIMLLGLTACSKQQKEYYLNGNYLQKGEFVTNTLEKEYSKKEIFDIVKNKDVKIYSCSGDIKILYVFSKENISDNYEEYVYINCNYYEDRSIIGYMALYFKHYKNDDNYDVEFIVKTARVI